MAKSLPKLRYIYQTTDPRSSDDQKQTNEKTIQTYKKQRQRDNLERKHKTKMYFLRRNKDYSGFIVRNHVIKKTVEPPSSAFKEKKKICQLRILDQQKYISKVSEK